MARSGVALALLAALSCGCSAGKGDGSCNPGDQDGVVGGQQTVRLSVTDVGYAVGGVGSGSTQANIAVQNSSRITLTLTNEGRKPHGLRIACIPTGLPSGCPAESCFPEAANFPALAPGDSLTVTFVTPVVEGAYGFRSEEPGDTEPDADGRLTGLIGQFVVM